MNVLLIDDEKEFTDKLQQHFITYFQSYKDDMIFEIKNNNFENIQFNNIDIAFIDIDLKVINGIDIARKITSISPKSIIIYFSYREDLIFETLDTNVFQFIRKNYYEKDIKIVFKKLEKYISNNKRIINYNGRQILININDIQYIISIGHQITIHNKDNEIVINSSINEILKLLQAPLLIQIQRGLIMNMNYIKEASRSKVTTIEGKQYEVGRKYRDNFINQYEEYLLKWY